MTTEAVWDMKSFIPHLDRSESNRITSLDKFSHYVAKQLGFEDGKECPEMRKLSLEYLKKSKGCEATIYDYFANHSDADNLYIKFCQEIETCILSYFAFHWTHASDMITQVLRAESENEIKIRNAFLAATRKQRFEKVTKNLNVTRVMSTLVEEMKVIGGGRGGCTEVMVPVAHNQRSPVLLLMGGGMGAGKSTVLKDLMKQPFWASAGGNAIVVEADAFKESDVIYKALNSSRDHHHDMLQTSELVHQSSTNAASSLLVTALNDGRDIILDGTLSWVPFVEQTIDMVRNVHNRRYRMGVGYKVAPDGTITENYWEPVPHDQEEDTAVVERADRKPYRIELAGVVCDAYLAVVRGIRRAVIVGRAVRVNSQLRSHKMFATAFPTYCALVDSVHLYCTNAINGAPPTLIAWKEGKENKLLVEPEDIKCLGTVSNLNADADDIYQLYPGSSPIYEAGSVWKDVVLSPSRPQIQHQLKAAILKIESHNKPPHHQLMHSSSSTN